MWVKHYQIKGSLNVKLRPHTAGSDLLELNVLNDSKTKIANVIFATIQDRKDRTLISIRNQNTFLKEYRKKRLMTLIHLFLIHRYKAESVHYVSPTDDNQKQTQGMKNLGIYSDVNTEIGDIIVAVVNTEHVKELLNPNQVKLKKFISKKSGTRNK